MSTGQQKPKAPERPRPTFDGMLACDIDIDPERFARADFPPTAGMQWGPDDDDSTENPFFETRNGVAFVNISGPIAQVGGYYWTGHQAIGMAMRAALAAARPGGTVSAIGMVINSPGGVVASMLDETEACRALVEASGVPVLSFSREVMASGAYGWGCIAGKVYLPKDGKVGSVGVLSGMTSLVKMNEQDGIKRVIVRSGSRKVDGHPDLPISDAAVGRMQASVDTMAGHFFDHVARCRGMTSEQVRALDGENFLGADAVDARLADAVMSYEAFVALCEEAGKARRMQSLATRVGLMATASETEIGAKIDEIKARADAAIGGKDAVAQEYRAFVTGWALETGRGTAAEIADLGANVSDVSALARILKARKPLAALPAETVAPAGAPAARGEEQKPADPVLAGILAKEYGAMTNMERQALATRAPSAYRAKRDAWTAATGQPSGVNIAAPAIATGAPQIDLT